MMSSQTMPDIMKEVTPDYSKSSPNIPETNTYFYIKMLLGLIVLSFLGYNILNYLADGTDIFTDFLKKLGLGIEKSSKKIIKTALPPLKKDKLKKVSNTDIYNEELDDDLQKDIDNKRVNPKKVKDRRSILDAVILGMFVYGVFAWTNYSLLKNWSFRVAVIDTVWGGILFGLTTMALQYIESVFRK